MTLSPEHQQILLDVARAAIAYGVEHGRAPAVAAREYPQALREVRATFVTLQRNGALRGCIGALDARLPLVEDVAAHAFAAAFQDPRFPALERRELEGLEVHISILSPAMPLRFESERDLLGQLRPGIDGLIIGDASHRATFLPSVWESLPEPADFLGHLKRKAGLEPGASHYSAWRYSAEGVPAA